MSGHNNVNRRILHRNLKSGASQLLPRFSPTAIFTTPSASPAATSSDSKTTDSAKSTPTPAKPTTPAQSSSPPPPAKTTTSSSVPKTTSTSTSSNPVTSTTPTSTLVPTTSTTSISTPSPVVSSTPALPPSTPTLPTSPDLAPTATGIVLPTSSSASTPTSTPSSNSVNTGAIVGGIAGGLAGLAILGFLIMFCLRRRRKRDQDEDFFNPDAFRRQSAILVDDPPPPPPVSYNPRPPTMIERKLTNASPALAAQQGYGQPPYGGGGYDVYGQNSFGPGELAPQIRSPPPASHQPFGAYGQSPLGSPASVAQYDSAYNQHGQLNRQPSNPTYLNRQDSMMNAPYGMVADPNAHYVDLNRSSVTPFQAAQYADITRRLASNSLIGVSEEAARGYAHDQSDKPLPSPYDSSPFHDSAASSASPRAPSPVHMTTSDQHVSAAHEPTTAEHSTSDDTFDEKKRPDTMYTVYEPGDAYAGFE